MAQSHTALRAISRLLKCKRGSHSERHLSPHPSPLPWGEGESSAASQYYRAWSLPDELHEQPKPAAGCSLSLWKRVRVRGISWPFDTAPRTLPEIVVLRESSGRAGGFPRQSPPRVKGSSAIGRIVGSYPARS